MPEIVLYIASSLDGFIARKDGDVSWLSPYQVNGQDYGYSEFLRSIDIIVMGSRTFEQLPSFGPWPYGDIKTYVLTRRELKTPEGARVVLHSGSLDGLITQVRKESQKGIWLVGGAAVAQSFLMHKAIDEIIISFIPILLGQGISLFGDTGAESGILLHESRLYQSGIVQLHYGIEYPE